MTHPSPIRTGMIATMAVAAVVLAGCTAVTAPPADPGSPTSSSPTAAAAPVADVADWFGAIDGYSTFDLSTGVPSQPIFLPERGAIEGTAVDGTRARAVNYESLAEPTGLVRQGFTATALFIETPADEESQRAAVADLVADTSSMPEGWEPVSLEQRTIGANDFSVIDSVQVFGDTTTNTRSWVAVVGSYLVTVTFAWAAAGAVPSAITPVYSADEVAAQTVVIETLLAGI